MSKMNELAAKSNTLTKDLAVRFFVVFSVFFFWGWAVILLHEIMGAGACAVLASIGQTVAGWLAPHPPPPDSHAFFRYYTDVHPSIHPILYTT